MAEYSLTSIREHLVYYKAILAREQKQEQDLIAESKEEVLAVVGHRELCRKEREQLKEELKFVMNYMRITGFDESRLFNEIVEVL